MSILLVRHVAGSDPPRFYVERPGGKATPPAEIPSPTGFAVEGRPNSDLRRELRWYLEEFLEYPFSPETEHAERILAALRAWGERAFDALFDNRDGATMFAAATASGVEALTLQVWSDDARILAWPWEALRDPKASALAPACAIERRLNAVLDPVAVPAGLPADRVNILLVIARPKEGDVKYRSISRSLVELIEKKNLPAYVHVLRPPTFGRLLKHLRERPGYYHLVHFDGHGSYGATPGPAGPHAYGAPEGALLFEDANGKEAPVSAEKLSALLQEHKVPAMVLNACRSAMLGEGDADPFASVAAALLKAGTRSVVAMSYSLYVSGAQQFLPAFYGRLFESGRFGEAARAGRQQMFAERGRVCVRGRYELQDWLVPVVYQQEAEALSFAAKGEPPVSRKKLPKEALDGENPYGLVGRDGAILEIERALRRPVPAILIHGLGGVGKTTLARGLVEWLAATEGLGEDCFWFSFQEIRSAEYVFNRMGEALFGGAFGAGKIEEKIEKLAAELRKQRFVIVWDNFEVVAGIKELAATLTETDRAYLRTFLQRLRGGATKVIITSRSDEEWLGSEQRRKVELGGLDGEERWTYADAILGDLGISIDRKDKELVELMKLLGGHPLAMRVVLPRLEGQRAAELCKALRHNLAALGEGGDEALKKLYATLKLAEDVLPEDLRPLLVPLGMHERYVDSRCLGYMAETITPGDTQAQADALLQRLASAGLIRHWIKSIYEIHPTLPSFLRANHAEGTSMWESKFVAVMANTIAQYTNCDLHEKQGCFRVHFANFNYALELVTRTGEQILPQTQLLEGLGVYARDTRNWSAAMALGRRLADLCSEAAHTTPGYRVGEARACHHLGMIAAELRDFVSARKYYRRALALRKVTGENSEASATYLNLGIVAQRQGNLARATVLFERSLALAKETNTKSVASSACHHLGTVAHAHHKLEEAQRWHELALESAVELNDDFGVGASYHSLGGIAADRNDFNKSHEWYSRALLHFGKISSHGAVADTQYQMAILAHQKGRRDLAESLYHKALLAYDKHGYTHKSAMVCGQVGLLRVDDGNFGEAAAWFAKSITGLLACRDLAGVQIHMNNIILAYQSASAKERDSILEAWKSCSLGELPLTN